jgi:hypothetical protein
VHAPRSSEGCIIFVRLRQFRDSDGRHVVDLPPLVAGRHSAFMSRPLFAGLEEHVVIMSFGPYTGIDFAAHRGLELLVLEGQLSACGEHLKPWSWLRLPADAPLTGAAASIGCTAWVKTAAPGLAHPAGIQTSP